MFDTGGQYHDEGDMCPFCEMTTGGHQPGCPYFTQTVNVDHPFRLDEPGEGCPEIVKELDYA